MNNSRINENSGLNKKAGKFEHNIRSRISEKLNLTSEVEVEMLGSTVDDNGWEQPGNNTDENFSEA